MYTYCNRVDNTHPDTLARPFTFAPLHLVSDVGNLSLLDSALDSEASRFQVASIHMHIFAPHN